MIWAMFSLVLFFILDIDWGMLLLMGSVDILFFFPDIWSLNLLNIHVVNLVAQPCVYPWFPDLRVYTEWDFPCSQQVYRQDTVVPGWRQVHFTNSGNILMNLVYLVITIDALSIWFYKRVINIRKKCDQPLLLEIDHCKPVVCNCFRRKLYF